MTQLGWQTDALCLQFDPDLFFPDKGNPAQGQRARQVCAACPVRADCLTYGMADQHGIYGGLTPLERQRLRNPRGRPLPGRTAP